MMVACAEYLGRNIKTCTRGLDNCVCKKELDVNREHDAQSSRRYKEDFDGLVEQYKKIEHLNARFKDLLRQIGYPRRGTEEEYMDIQDAANLIQSNFSIDDLEQ